MNVLIIQMQVATRQLHSSIEADMIKKKANFFIIHSQLEVNCSLPFKDEFDHSK